MKIERTKEWWLALARAEGDSDTSAGSVGADKVSVDWLRTKGVEILDEQFAKEALIVESRTVSAIIALLETIPSEYEHGDPVHDERNGIIARLKRDEWREMLKK